MSALGRVAGWWRVFAAWWHGAGGYVLAQCGEHCLYCCSCTECGRERMLAMRRAGVAFGEPKPRPFRDGRLWIGKLSIYLDPRDSWVGVFSDPIGRYDDVFLCPVPCLVFRYWHPGAFAGVLAVLTLVAGFAVPEPVGMWLQLYLFALLLGAGWQCVRRMVAQRRKAAARAAAEHHASTKREDWP